MSHAAAVLSEYRTIPLSLLVESTTNPRRTFEPSKLVELAQSISVSGLIQPITVRPKEDRFEIIAGARRYRAAQIAELAEVPTRVLALDDAQMLEVQIVENSQREDVHPYEEASSYQRLLDLPGYDVAALSSKCSKSQSHIYARLTLLSLIPEVAEAFQKDEITASHANLLARLSAEQQAQAFPNAFRKDYRDDERHLLPAKHLAAWIQDNLYLALVEAPFDRESASLLPEAGSCHACPKRTGFNTALFADVTDDNCLDGECFRAKINAHIESAKAGVANLVQISTVWRPAQDKPTAELSPMEYRKIGATGRTTILFRRATAPLPPSSLTGMEWEPFIWCVQTTIARSTIPAVQVQAPPDAQMTILRRKWSSGSGKPTGAKRKRKSVKSDFGTLSCVHLQPPPTSSYVSFSQPL
jgi:ParB family chromosome partitioning protein